MSDFSTRLDDIGRSTTEPSLRLGRLGAPSHDSSLKSLISNLKDAVAYFGLRQVFRLRKRPSGP